MKHQFAAAYAPGQQREPLNLSYVGKPSQRLQLFAEYKAGQSSEFMGGFKMRFMEGAITGYMNSQMKVHSIYEKRMEGNMKFELNSMIDFKNARKCLFGMNVHMELM